MPKGPEILSPANPTFVVGGAGELVFLMAEFEGRGWAAFFDAEAEHPTAFVRFAGRPWSHNGSLGPIPLGDGTTAGGVFYEVVELFMGDQRALTGRDLRGLPLGQIVSVVNQGAASRQMAALAADAGQPHGLLLETLAMAGLNRRVPRYRRPPMVLKMPAGARKPDSFYEAVAARVGWLQGEGLSPAKELAEANGVPETTVHRWVKEARRRGLMSPGRRSSRNGTP